MKRRILVVDDQGAARWVVSKLLERYGYDVHVADGGANAISAVDGGDFDLAIVDYLMPEIDGLTVFQQLRERRPGLRGIFLTGHLDNGTAAAALEAGFDRVVAKPASAETLLPLLEELLGSPN
ncbi:MAG: response regulator [Planctomycetia bacterium]|nr:response regulator [Planctomycetia bacterium]